MPFIDFVILLLVIWALYKGWRQGFLKEIISMVGFVVGLFVAAGLYSSFGEYLSPHIGASPTVANILAFLVLWIVVPIVLGLVANLLTKALKGMKIEESLYEKTTQLIREEINPRDSWRASRAFRLQIGGEIAARALRRTVELAGGDRI